MKAVLIVIATAIAVAGCSAGAGPMVSDAGAAQIGGLDKQGRAGHEN